MAELTIRVRTSTRMVRVQVPNGCTVAELRAKVATELGAVPAKLKMSLKPDYSVILKDAEKVAGAAWPNGAMIYVNEGVAAVASAPVKAGGASAPSTSASVAGAASSPAKASPRKLTARCTHGPNGACAYCMAVTDEDMLKLKDEPLNKAGRFAPRHAEKSAALEKEGKLTGELEWLCHHRPDQMCSNCAPLQKGDSVALEMLCLHGAGGRCTNCLPPDSSVKGRKYQTYAEWDKERTARCEHGPGAMCPSCTPPHAVSYKFKVNCEKHQPWPKGMCSECTPPLASLAAQKYRHIDFIHFNNAEEVKGFLSLWRKNEARGVQRAGWLYGYTAPDPNYPSGTRAVVEAIYEPPQVFDPPTGAIRLLPDSKKQKEADAVAAACGLRRVGWLFTKPPKFKTDPTVMPREMQAMAMLQCAFPQSGGLPGSQFVTVVARADEHDNIAPEGFQATDQMMALVRDRVIADASPTDQKMKVRLAAAGEPPIAEVIFQSNLRGRQRGVTEFDVEIGLMTIETGMGVGGPKDPKPVFKHAVFPVENRREFGVEQKSSDLKKLLALFRDEPMHSRLSDFHALVFLASVFDADTAAAIAGQVCKGQPLEDGFQLMIEDLASR